MSAQSVSERPHIRAMRNVFRNWPLPHGKGILLKAFRPWLRGDVTFEALPGVSVSGPLSDFTFLWHFTRPTDSEETLQYALSMVKDGCVFLDVGANFGLWSMAVAKKTGGKAYAFDPLPANVNRLIDNIRMNGLSDRIEVIPQAVSDSVGEVSFSDPGGGNSAVGRMADKGDTLTVPATTLDAFCSSRGIDRVDLVKIDVEGAEMLVLRGGRELFSRADAPTLIFELDPQMPKDFGVEPSEVLDLVRSYGYKTFVLSDRGRTLVRVPDPLVSQVDVIAIKHR